MKFKGLNHQKVNKEDAIKEANRCLGCKIPSCEKGCPANNNIKDFIKAFKEDDINKAFEIIENKSVLPGICSVVCNHYDQCSKNCILNKKNDPIKIGMIEEYITLNHTNLKAKTNNKSKAHVLIIGGGPSGLSCALFLSRNNIKVTIYEKEDFLGGLLISGIPSFRLPFQNIKDVISKVENNDLIEVVYNKEVTYDEIIKLQDSFDYIYISIGLQMSKKLDILNEEYAYDAIDLLKKYNLNEKLNKGKVNNLNGTTLVLGCGNVAIDASRVALRLGSSKVIVVYRRTLNEAPASTHEIETAKKEGVEFMFLTAPKEIVVKNNEVSSLVCDKMILGESDESNRRRPVRSGETINISCDNIIKAIGQSPKIIEHDKLVLDYGYIVTNNHLTNIKNVYAGGDITLGASTVVKCMAVAKEVAYDIINKVNSKS